MQTLLVSNLWPEIEKLSHKAKRVQAAIAYFSSDKYLHLKKGDAIIVNASERVIETGGTSAKVIAKLIHRGVVVKHFPDLHAKVLAIDDKVVVGSGNASQSSADLLTEAAILTDAAQTVSQVRSFLHQLALHSTVIGKAELTRLLKIKVASHGWNGGQSKKNKKSITSTGDRVWIVNVRTLSDDAYPQELEFVNSAEKRLEKSQPDVEPSWIRWAGKGQVREHAANGDQVIVISKMKGEKTPYEVCPPSSILSLGNNFKYWQRRLVSRVRVATSVLTKSAFRKPLNSTASGRARKSNNHGHQKI